MENNSIKHLKLKKTNLSLNTRARVIFNEENDTEAFYATSNKIIQFDFKSNIIIDTYSVGKKFIHKFNILKENIFILSEGEFHQFSFLHRKITNTFKHDKIIQNFIFSHFLNSFILISTNDIIVLDTNFTIRKHKTFDNNLSSLCDINNDGNGIILTNKNNLIIVNLINFEVNNLIFTKSLTAVKYINLDIVVGDSSGKIHFIYPNNCISSKHWHSHKIKSFETNGDILYSAGEEGVIVIWNLKNEKKSYMPRIQSVDSMSLSNDNQTLCVSCSDNNIKFINLFNNSVLSFINGIDKNSKIKVENYTDYLLLLYRDNGKVQFVNKKNNIIVTNDSIMNRNFVSRTEKEEINLKKLEHVKLNESYMITYEEVHDDMLFISYLKLWKKISFDNFELLSIAENPHNNLNIKNIIIADNSFITFSDKSFKYWIIENSKFVCSFIGSYKEDIKILTSVCMSETLIYSIHGNTLIEWDIETRNISRLYALDEEITNIYIQAQNIIIHNSNRLYILNKDIWEIIVSEPIKNIIKIYTTDKNVLILVNKDIYYILIKFEDNEFQACAVMKKNNIKHIEYDTKTNSFISFNNNYEIFSTGNNLFKKRILGKKTNENNYNLFNTELPPELENKCIPNNYDDIFEENLKRLKHK